MNSKGMTGQKVASDKELVQEFLSDKTDAFEGLVLKYQDMIFNLCYRMMGDYDEANDCAQETFIRVYKNLKKFRQESAFSTWIYRIAVNVCKNRLSSSVYRIGKKAIRLDSKGRGNSGENTFEVTNGKSNPVRAFEQKEKAAAIERAIDTLPGIQKIVIVLRDIEGKSYEEIGEITGLKIGTVKSKLSRARERLREVLRGVL